MFNKMLYSFLQLVILSLTSTMSFALCAEEVSFPAQSHEEKEALFLRRVVEFWEEGQYSLAKAEIEKYLQEHPQSSFSNYLHALLGDIYSKEENYEQSFLAYRKINDNQIKLSVFINYLQALFECKKQTQLIEECAFYLKNYPNFNEEISRQVKIYLGYAYYEKAIDPQEQDAASYARMAKPYFEDLLKVAYNEDAIAILTTLHHILKDYKSASDLYFSLAEKYSEKKEEFLLQAANCALEFDKELALKTYASICRVGKTKVQEAADQRMLLLFEMKRYSDLILLSDSLVELCSKENLPFFHFLLGKSYFELKDYKHAALEMKKYLDREGERDERTRDALAMVMSAAHQMKNRDLFEEAFSLFEKNYPQDEEIPKALLAKAILNKNEARFVEAEKDFSRLEKQAAQLEDQETFLFAYGDLLLQMKEGQKSKDIFSQLLQITKDVVKKREYLRSFVNAAVLLAFEEKEKEKTELLKKELIQSLQMLLAEKEALSESERIEYLYLLGQTQFECGDFAATLEVLEPLTKDFPKCRHIAQAHLFLAQCYDLIKKDKKSFCEHVEKALFYQDPSLKSASLHLLLFNGYFQLAQENKELLRLAAEHLYRAQQDKTMDIQEENRLWLSQYYYQRVEHFMKEGQWLAKEEEKSFLKDEMARSIELLEIKEMKEDLSPQEEEDLFHLANLYFWQHDEKKALDLFERLTIQYKKNPSICWMYRDAVLLQLASLYEIKGERDKEKSLLEEVLLAKRNPQAYVEAMLQKCRLGISLLKEEEKELSSPIVAEILSDLKNLQLQRKLETEPFHFEAALTYIDFQTSLEKEKPIEKRLALAQQFKEFFFSEEDILSKDYQEERKKKDDKDRLLQSYSKILDLEILLSKIALERETNLQEAMKDLQAANELLHSFFTENFIITSDLYRRIHKDKEALQQEEKMLSLSEKR